MYIYLTHGDLFTHFPYFTPVMNSFPKPSGWQELLHHQWLLHGWRRAGWCGGCWCGRWNHFLNCKKKVVGLGEWWSFSWWYCWWKKSCTSWYDKYPIFNRVLYIPGGAAFLPSTVSYDTMPFEMMIKIFSRKKNQPEFFMQSMDGFTQHFIVPRDVFDACGDDLSKFFGFGIHWSTKKGHMFVGKAWSSYST